MMTGQAGKRRSSFETPLGGPTCQKRLEEGWTTKYTPYRGGLRTPAKTCQIYPSLGTFKGPNSQHLAWVEEVPGFWHEVCLCDRALFPFKSLQKSGVVAPSSRGGKLKLTLRAPNNKEELPIDMAHSPTNTENTHPWSPRKTPHTWKMDLPPKAKTNTRTWMIYKPPTLRTTRWPVDPRGPSRAAGRQLSREGGLLVPGARAEEGHGWSFLRKGFSMVFLFSCFFFCTLESFFFFERCWRDTIWFYVYGMDFG